MSRSYMKNMGGSWACGSDKYLRSMYQRSFRRRANRFCRELQINFTIEEIFNTEEDLPTDHIVNGIDYACRFADRWTWPSDGGTFIKETASSLKQKLESELFGYKSDWTHPPQNIWERYKTALSYNNLNSYFFVDLIVVKKLAKHRFNNCDDLVLWMREHQKWLISIWKKINFGK